jgi:hypothetical protein
VAAVSAELGLAEEWIGKHNREAQTLSVLKLRESAMRLGLLRKYRDMLLATPRGRKLRGDPPAWWHLAGHVPPANIARDAAADTCITLVRLGALARDHRGPAPDRPTRDGAIFARTALHASMPGGLGVWVSVPVSGVW